MIYAVGQVPGSLRYGQSTFREFLLWEQSQTGFQLDIETTMTEWWCDKEIITIQLGRLDGKDQWVLEWASLTSHQKEMVKEILQNNRKVKLIHNALFEYVVLRFHGIIIENIYDTMLAEQVLNGGLKMEVGWYSLSGLCDRYLCYTLDKTEQKGFTHEPLREAQIIYAADDVKPLGFIRRMQIERLKVNLHSTPLENTAALEMEALLSYGDMVYNGMEMDVDAWLANLDLVEPIIQEAESSLYKAMHADQNLFDKAVELGYINQQDKLLINWASAQAKIKLVQLLDPELMGTAKAYLGKQIKSGHENSDWLQAFVDERYPTLEANYLKYFRDELIEVGLLRPAGDTYINWNSQPQVLPLFQAVDSKLKALSEDALNKFVHPIGKLRKEYTEALKLRGTYGEEFVKKHLEPDGKVRTTINQVLTTGRVSSYNPNMQNIPAKESVGNRYRNCFIAPKGSSYVSGDYTGQELCVIAYLSKDPVWTEALMKGQDIHSVCAEMVYPVKWKAAAEPNCAYYVVVSGGGIAKMKCECKKHKPIRYDTKSIDFGLAYGMTEYKLAGDVGIPVPAARRMIGDYFSAFPKIGGLLNHFASFAVKHGYIQTIWPFYRKRFFPEWNEVTELEKEMHIKGIKMDWRLAAIERAAKNMPIQGTSGDMAKLSVCMIRWYLHEKGLQDTIFQVMQVHDQNDTITNDELAEWWKPELKRIMEEAAYFLIPNGLVKSDVSITQSWSK